MKKFRLLLAVLMMSAMFVGCDEGDRGIPDIPYPPQGGQTGGEDEPGGGEEPDDPNQGGDTPSGEIDPNKNYPFFTQMKKTDML